MQGPEAEAPGSPQRPRPQGPAPKTTPSAFRGFGGRGSLLHVPSAGCRAPGGPNLLMGLGAGSEEGTRGAPAEREPVRTPGCAASADAIQPEKASFAGVPRPAAHRPACSGQVVCEEHPTGLHVTILLQVCETALVEPVRRGSSDILVSSSQFQSTCPAPLTPPLYLTA